MKNQYYYMIGGLLVGGIAGYSVANNQYSRLKTETHSDFRGKWWWENWEDYKRRMLRYNKEHPD